MPKNVLFLLLSIIKIAKCWGLCSAPRPHYLWQMGLKPQTPNFLCSQTHIGFQQLGVPTPDKPLMTKSWLRA